MSGIRSYKKIPVWVVENHNEALEPIYRAIGSRHLPFEGISMLHFDSHPDLQINPEVDADVAFSKEELLSSISIENWITPAIYSGHLQRITWIKPPWATQLPEGSRKVKIGKHKSTGKMRINWPDSYFVSDVLYAAPENMENVKSAEIDVVTMETPCLKTSDFQLMLKQSQAAGVHSSGHCEGLNRISSAEQSAIEQGEGTCNSDEGKRMSQSTEERDSPGDQKDSTLYECSDSPSTRQVKRTDASCGPLDDVVKHFSESRGRFILDIDLDFFSTKNPFRELYTKEQYRLLEELYQFNAPHDDSLAALEECQAKRAQQISELALWLKTAFQGGHSEKMAEITPCDRERYGKVTKLVESLQSTPDAEAECLDPEMVHMAGLTCDDSGELPHHISTEEEVGSLVSAMGELLGCLPPPTLVTIARSSYDDYCPPHQVDGIQQKVLKKLQSLYGEIDIHLQYEES
ncbi:UPF0489 protein C5orf22 homolog [Diadema setosum]|uniref:UPF0489 protein C5orf22 homolog n=1 Tax=Diadema setosum TaxID=31175 RepID=UPI003B3B9E00